ncbi:MAG: sulfite dehydrogenase [Alphaproteobacteria bacterium]|nr:sulfite dehydrogenase [Alphaproteobacteria bacterium]
MAKFPTLQDQLGDPIAGNGLLHRRFFLQSGAAIAGAAATLGTASAESIGTAAPEWTKKPGAAFNGYGVPSHWRDNIQRLVVTNAPPGREVAGSSRTPLEMMEGTITPGGLHYVRNHNGTPDVDPNKHELMIHGLVRQPLVFTLDNLLRYPMESRIHFVECAGNSGAISASAEPQQVRASTIHGLLSCSEWTGVKLSTLLEEAGLDKRGTWILAEGADSAAMSRSVPVWKALDDAMIALYQNGEPIRPEQGFPMRLLLPGFEGNTNVKWLRRMKVMDGPMYSRDETSRYTELMPDGKAREFMLQMEPKSLILKPSFGINMQGPGYYEISGLAWSGLGRVRRVDVSADGGKSWAEAALSAPVQTKALTRFRLPWMWNGQPAVLTSRTTDDKGVVQMSRAQWVAQYAPRQNFHFSAMQSWAVDAGGKVSNVYV